MAQHTGVEMLTNFEQVHRKLDAQTNNKSTKAFELRVD